MSRHEFYTPEDTAPHQLVLGEQDEHMLDPATAPMQAVGPYMAALAAKHEVEAHDAMPAQQLRRILEAGVVNGVPLEDLVEEPKDLLDVANFPARHEGDVVAWPELTDEQLETVDRNTLFVLDAMTSEDFKKSGHMVPLEVIHQKEKQKYPGYVGVNGSLDSTNRSALDLLRHRFGVNPEDVASDVSSDSDLGGAGIHSWSEIRQTPIGSGMYISEVYAGVDITGHNGLSQQHASTELWLSYGPYPFDQQK